MNLLRPAAVLLAAATTLLYAQRAFRLYPSVEGYSKPTPAPPDPKTHTEWTSARLMYPPGPLDGYYPRFQGPWQQGLSLWTQDYPSADRKLAAAVQRLTRIDARGAEQPVSIDDDD